MVWAVSTRILLTEQRVQLVQSSDIPDHAAHRLANSEKQLLDLIEKLNQESEQRFIETFKSVAEHFSALFKKLFAVVGLS